MFFFSSRRRHTRSTRDWSSDVCSSDLPARNQHGGFALHHRREKPQHAGRERFVLQHRSEERRVGKECRSRRGGERLEKNERDTKGEGSGERAKELSRDSRRGARGGARQ